jgi:phosphoribosylformylglycinamidine synthase
LAFTALCDELGQPFSAIGAVHASSGTLEITDQFTVSLDDLRAAHTGTLARAFGAAAAVSDH